MTARHAAMLVGHGFRRDERFAAEADSEVVRTMTTTLEERYADDPVLLRFYATNLPKAGRPERTSNRSE